ncbi:hypothetical protein J6590_075636 [Homalodisca vitripennis]|nr:hypothetical protein J6590_075636 [Homalodisca vitripennis]
MGEFDNEIESRHSLLLANIQKCTFVRYYLPPDSQPKGWYCQNLVNMKKGMLKNTKQLLSPQTSVFHTCVRLGLSHSYTDILVGVCITSLSTVVTQLIPVSDLASHTHTQTYSSVCVSRLSVRWLRSSYLCQTWHLTLIHRHTRRCVYHVSQYGGYAAHTCVRLGLSHSYTDILVGVCITSLSSVVTLLIPESDLASHTHTQTYSSVCVSRLSVRWLRCSYLSQTWHLTLIHRHTRRCVYHVSQFGGYVAHTYVRLGISHSYTDILVGVCTTSLSSVVMLLIPVSDLASHTHTQTYSSVCVSRLSVRWLRCSYLCQTWPLTLIHRHTRRCVYHVSQFGGYAAHTCVRLGLSHSYTDILVGVCTTSLSSVVTLHIPVSDLASHTHTQTYSSVCITSLSTVVTSSYLCQTWPLTLIHRHTRRCVPRLSSVVTLIPVSDLASHTHTQTYSSVCVSRLSVRWLRCSYLCETWPVTLIHRHTRRCVYHVSQFGGYAHTCVRLACYTHTQTYSSVCVSRLSVRWLRCSYLCETWPVTLIHRHTRRCVYHVYQFGGYTAHTCVRLGLSHSYTDILVGVCITSLSSVVTLLIPVSDLAFHTHTQTYSSVCVSRLSVRWLRCSYLCQTWPLTLIHRHSRRCVYHIVISHRLRAFRDR